MGDYIIPEKYIDGFNQAQKMIREQDVDSTTWDERLDNWTRTIDSFFYTGGDSYYCYAPARKTSEPDETDKDLVSCLLATVTINTDGENTIITFGLVPERRGIEVDDYEIEFDRRDSTLTLGDLDALACHCDVVAYCIVTKKIIDAGIEPLDELNSLMIALVARTLFVSNACYSEPDAETVQATEFGRRWRSALRAAMDKKEAGDGE